MQTISKIIVFKDVPGFQITERSYCTARTRQ